MRGATNRILLLTDDEKSRGVVAFSSGNHAQAVALAAREAGVRAVIAMPTDAPKAKVAGTRGYGAEVVFYDRQKEDREAVARGISEQDGLVMVPPYDDYQVMAGQGTCALELLEEVPDLDCLLTPCSGGGYLPARAWLAGSIRNFVALPSSRLAVTTPGDHSSRVSALPFRLRKLSPTDCACKFPAP